MTAEDDVRRHLRREPTATCPKSAQLQELLQAIRAVHAGGTLSRSGARRPFPSVRVVTSPAEADSVGASVVGLCWSGRGCQRWRPLPFVDGEDFSLRAPANVRPMDICFLAKLPNQALIRNPL